LPDFVAALRNRATSYDALGDTAKAQADFSSVLQLDPNEPERIPVQYRRQGN
jgi:Flp pilus assembly protein TadD